MSHRINELSKENSSLVSEASFHQSLQDSIQKLPQAERDEDNRTEKADLQSFIKPCWNKPFDKKFEGIKVALRK